MARLPDIPVDLWRNFQSQIFGEKADSVESAESFRWSAGDAIDNLPPSDGTDWEAEARRLEEEQRRRQEEQRRQIEEQARRDQEDYQRILDERAVASQANQLAATAPPGTSTYNDPTAGGTQSQPISFADTANNLIGQTFGPDTAQPMPQEASDSERYVQNLSQPSEPAPPPLRNTVPYEPATGRTGEPANTPAQTMSFADTANNLMQQAFGPEPNLSPSVVDATTGTTRSLISDLTRPVPQPGTERPIQNPDGSVTTERSITVTDPDLNNGRATNIPSVWGGQIVSDDEAVDNAIRSGRSWPSFDSIDEAEAAARQRSADLGAGRERSIGGTSLPYDSREADQGPHERGVLQQNTPAEPSLLERAGRAIGSAVLDNPAARTVTREIAPAVSGAIKQAGQGLDELINTYGAGKVARDMQRERELQDEQNRFLQAQGHPLTPRQQLGQGEIDPAWEAANPEKADELRQIRDENTMAIGGMAGTGGGGGLTRDAVDAIKALRVAGVAEDVILAAERSLAEGADMALSKVQILTRGVPTTTAEGVRLPKPPVEARPVEPPLPAEVPNPFPLTAEEQALNDAADARARAAPPHSGYLEDPTFGVEEPAAAGPQPGDNIRLPDGTRARVEEPPPPGETVYEPPASARTAPPAEPTGRPSIPYAASKQGLDALYHETDPTTALLWPQEITSTALRGLNVSPDPALALGQGGRGALVEFVNTDQIAVRAMRGKPGAAMMEAAGQQAPEWEITNARTRPAELIGSITIKPDAQLPRLARNVMARLSERDGWTREVLPDGSVKLTNPTVGAAQAAESAAPQVGERIRLPDGTRATVTDLAPTVYEPPRPAPLAPTVYEPPRTTAGGGGGARRSPSPPPSPLPAPPPTPAGGGRGAGGAPPAPPTGGAPPPPIPPPPLGSNAADAAREAQRGPARGAMLNRAVQAPDSAVPARVQAAAKTTDPLAAVRWAEDMLTEMAGGKKMAENDPRRASTLARINASGIANHRIEQELEPVVLDAAHAGLQHELPQYLEDLQQQDILKDFFRRGYEEAIAAGKSVQEATDAGVARLRQRQGAATDMTYEQIDARLKGREQALRASGKWDTLQELAQEVWDSNARNLRRARDAGEISVETYDTLQARFPHYVPTVPISHLDPSGAGRGIGGSANKVTRGATPLVKSLDDVGTSGERLNPIVATRGAIVRTERAAARNEIANRFAQMYDDAVAAGGLTPPTQKEVRQLWNGTEAVHYFLDGEPQVLHVPKPVADGIEASAAAGMDEFSNLYKRLVRGVTQNITGRRGGFIFTNLARDTGDYMVRRMAEEGGPHHLPGAMLTWADEAGKALADIARANANVRGAAGAGAGAIAATAQDDANTPLDVRLRHAGEGAIVGMFLGGANRVRSTGRAAQYVERGGGMGGIQSTWKANQNWYQSVLRDGGAPIRNVGDFGNFLKQWGKEIATFQGVGGINERAELIGRTASMRRAEAGGAGALESMIAGRNASIDFDRYGSLVRAINGYIPFFGATTQGGAQFYRTLIRDHPVVGTASILATIGPPLLLAEAWNRSDPQRARAYDDVPQYLKDSGLVVMLPWAGSDVRGSRPNYLWLPGQMIAPFIIAGREAMRNLPGLEPSAGRADVNPEAGDVERWANLFGTIAGTFSPIKGESPGAVAGSMMPPVVKQIAELATNTDLYRGGAIASDFNDQRASAFGRVVAGGINELGRQAGATSLQNVKPSHIDYLARQLPSYGDITTGASDLVDPSAYKGTENRPVANEPGAGGVVGRFVRDTGGANLERAQAGAWTPGIQSAVSASGLRPSDLTLTVPSIVDDVPLTRDEQVRAQQAFNHYVAAEVARMQAHPLWRTPSRREEMLKDAIATAREHAQADVMRAIPAPVRAQRARAATSMAAGR